MHKTGALTKQDDSPRFPQHLHDLGDIRPDKEDRVLADALMCKGILVLRYDKRGVGGSTGNYGDAATADFASDAQAAVDWLATLPDADRRYAGVIGHSEGGVIAPMVAAADKRVAFVVMLAGPGMRGDKLFVEQAAEVARASGAPRSYVGKRPRCRGRLDSDSVSG